jgi:hypothetical protein
MERIAEETEEDYQKLIKLLESFGVKVLRPNVSEDYEFYKTHRIEPPPMTPRDYSIMLGTDFYMKPLNLLTMLKMKWAVWRGDSWPADPPATYDEYLTLPESIRTELHTMFHLPSAKQNVDERTYIFEDYNPIDQFAWKDVIADIQAAGNTVYNNVPPELHYFNNATTTHVGKDLYVGTEHYGQDITQELARIAKTYPEYRVHRVDTGGHSDGTYCPVHPGLIISLYDIPTYQDTFPGWEVIYLPGQSWGKLTQFMKLKEKNRGKWWVPGEELNDEFTDFVEGWLGHWVGYVEETVFDVNMLVIDEKNVVCNNYNEKVFEAFGRYGITPHVCNFRHRYFWDGGLHCITSDVHREGQVVDYFPERA